ELPVALQRVAELDHLAHLRAVGIGQAGLVTEGEEERRAVSRVGDRVAPLDTVHLHDSATGMRASCRDVDRVFAARSLDDPEPADDLLALGERAVADDWLAVVQSDAR